MAILEFAIDVADCIDTRHIGAQMVIRQDVATLVHRQAAAVCLEPVAVAGKTGSDEDLICGKDLLDTGRFVAHGHLLFACNRLSPDRFNTRPDTDPDPAELFFQQSADFRLFVFGQTRVMIHDRDLSPIGRENMGKFGADNAATDDQEALVRCGREFVAKETLKIDKTCLDQSFNGGLFGPATHADHDHLGPDGVCDLALGIQDLEHIRLGESSRALENGQARPRLVGFQDLAIFPDFIPHPLAQLFPVNRGWIDHQTDLFAPFTLTDRIGGMDQDFGGDTAAIEAGTAKFMPFYQGTGLALGQSRLQDNQGGTTADHDQIKILHMKTP